MKISEIYRNERTQKLLGLLSLYLVYVLFFKSVSFSSLWGKFFIDKYDLKSYLMYEISKRLITLIISVFIICVLFKNKLDLDDSKKMNLIKSILIAITVFLLYYFLLFHYKYNNKINQSSTSLYYMCWNFSSNNGGISI